MTPLGRTFGRSGTSSCIVCGQIREAATGGSANTLQRVAALGDLIKNVLTFCRHLPSSRTLESVVRRQPSPSVVGIAYKLRRDIIDVRADDTLYKHEWSHV